MKTFIRLVSFWVTFVIVGVPLQIDQPLTLRWCNFWLSVLNVKGIGFHFVWKVLILEGDRLGGILPWKVQMVSQLSDGFINRSRGDWQRSEWELVFKCAHVHEGELRVLKSLWTEQLANVVDVVLLQKFKHEAYRLRRVEVLVKTGDMLASVKEGFRHDMLLQSPRPI